MGNFFRMLKFDLSSLSRSHDQKIFFLGTPTRHRHSGKSTDRRSQTEVIKISVFLYLPHIFFIIGFTALQFF